MNKGRRLNIFKNGILGENPVLKLVLGTCPVLATSTSVITGISMGAGVIFVLLCSNVLISLLRNIIPQKVRIPVYITIIATFVTVVDRVMAKYMPDVYEKLGLFIPLIVVNCIILARAESFASKNSVLDSAIDGISMGIGFTLAIAFMAFIRELLGNGSIFGIKLRGFESASMTIFILPAGGFLTYGFIIALVNYITDKNNKKKVQRELDAKKVVENE